MGFENVAHVAALEELMLALGLGPEDEELDTHVVERCGGYNPDDVVLHAVRVDERGRSLVVASTNDKSRGWFPVLLDRVRATRMSADPFGHFVVPPKAIGEHLQAGCELLEDTFSVRLRSGRHVILTVCNYRIVGTVLMHLHGPRPFLLLMQDRARTLGYELDALGFYNLGAAGTPSRLIPTPNGDVIFGALGLGYIPLPMRAMISLQMVPSWPIIPVRGSRGDTYHLTVGPTGPMSCTCPDYSYRGIATGTPCKHMEQYVQAAGLPVPAKPKQRAPKARPTSKEKSKRKK